jgi:uncharacterized protein (DUF305 family)
MKNTTTLLYIIIGLLLMILVSHFYYISSTQAQMMRGNYRTFQSGNMMHQVQDGYLMMGGQASMGATMDNMMSGLNGKTGDDFDKAFLSEMIVHHQGAVAMAQAVLKNSKRPELIKLANDIISAQTSEITTMQNWQKTWFAK